MKTMDKREESLRRVAAGFEKLGRGRPDALALAPGRVNVIGEHVDYNGGWVLPAAIEREVAVALKRRDDRRVALQSSNLEDHPPEFSVDRLEPASGRCWSNYVRGVIAGLKERGYDVPGFDAFVLSDIPIGAGLSSSAALEAVFGKALLALMGEEMEPLELAKLCQAAEHGYAGVPCGLMDQAAVILGRDGHLLLLDCETEAFEHAPFEDPDWGLLIINSGVAHELADGEYAKRRSACHEAANRLGVSSLRHIDSQKLEEALARPELSEEMRRCVRHVVTENDRTRALVTALKQGDYAEAGRQMNASHRSLSEDYGVSCLELDFIAATAQSLEGVAGCRMTGGGFGGSAIALVRMDGIERVATTVRDAYAEQYGRPPIVFATRPAAGAEAWRYADSPVA